MVTIRVHTCMHANINNAVPGIQELILRVVCMAVMANCRIASSGSRHLGTSLPIM